jgi:hypothetical protein
MYEESTGTPQPSGRWSQEAKTFARLACRNLLAKNDNLREGSSFACFRERKQQELRG